MNSRAEYNRSRVPRLRVDLEGWKQTKSKTPTIQVEEGHEQEYETSLTLSDLKRKGSNDEENKQRKPKRIKLDKLEGWGESVTEDNVDENLPEGWWQKEQVIENETVSTGSRVQGSDLTTDESNKKKKFKYKKKGKLNKAEERELKKTCASLLTWVTVPNNPPPIPSTPTMNDTQEETDDMEWEEMGREEKLERVRKKKESWELSKMSMAIVVDIVKEAVVLSEEKPIREMVEDIVLEGWRHVETARIMNMILDAEDEIKGRVIRYCLEKQAEEECLLLTLKLEEERQRRLKRTEVLKNILRKKMNAQELKKMLRMMRLMSLEDLEMEVGQVEARATELMETEDIYDEPSIEMKTHDDAPSTQQGEMQDMECDQKYDALSNSQGSSSQEGVVGTKIVRDLNLDYDVNIFIPGQSKLKNSSGSFSSIFQRKNSFKPEPKQTVSLWKSKRNGGKKRKFEGADLVVDYGPNEAKRQCGSC